MLSLSLCLLHCTPKTEAIEMFIYASIIIATLMRGNKILASRTIDCPDTYTVEKLKLRTHSWKYYKLNHELNQRRINKAE